MSKKKNNFAHSVPPQRPFYVKKQAIKLKTSIRKPFFAFKTDTKSSNMQEEAKNIQTEIHCEHINSEYFDKYKENNFFPSTQTKSVKSLQKIKSSIYELQQTLKSQKKQIVQQQLMIREMQTNKLKRQELRNFYRQIKKKVHNYQSTRNIKIAESLPKNFQRKNMVIFTSIKSNLSNSFKQFILTKKGIFFSNQFIDIGFRIKSGKILIVFQYKKEIAQLNFYFLPGSLSLEQNSIQKTYFNIYPYQRSRIELRLVYISPEQFKLQKFKIKIRDKDKNHQFLTSIPITPFSFMQFCEPKSKQEQFKGTTQWFPCRFKSRQALQIAILNYFSKGVHKSEGSYFIGFRYLSENKLQLIEFEFIERYFRIKGEANIRLFRLVNYIIELFVAQQFQ